MKKINLRMTLGLVFGSLIHLQMASAAELTIVKASTTGPVDSASYIVGVAKQMAIAKLPHQDFLLQSPWGVSQVTGSGGRQIVHVTAEAAFMDLKEQGPWYVSVSENRFGWLNENDVSAAITRGMNRATGRAKFYCNSEVIDQGKWEIQKQLASNGNIELTVSGRFQCN